MKIDNQIKVSGNATLTEGKARTGRAAANTGKAGDAAETDYATLSTQLQEIEAALANTPVVNAERVAEIKQAISEGRFTVNAERVADRLIDSVREMINTKGE